MPLPSSPSANADLLRAPIGPGSVHVERYGFGGRPVVLLHGFATSAFLWRHVGPALAVAGARAFAIDLVGYGESDRPLGQDYGIAAQAEALDRALTALRIASATVVGVDVGGAVALRFATEYPERVSGLVLVNSLAAGHCPAEDVNMVQWRSARFALRVARGLLGATPVLRAVLERMVADPAHMPPRLVARYLAPYVGREGITHLLTLARAIRDEELDDLPLADLRVPTLVLRGDEDALVDARASEELAAAIPGARIERLPRVARLLPEEVPDLLARRILEVAGLRARESDSETGRETSGASELEPLAGAGASVVNASAPHSTEPDDPRPV